MPISPRSHLVNASPASLVEVAAPDHPVGIHPFFRAQPGIEIQRQRGLARPEYAAPAVGGLVVLHHLAARAPQEGHPVPRLLLAAGQAGTRRCRRRDRSGGAPPSSMSSHVHCAVGCGMPLASNRSLRNSSTLPSAPPHGMAQTCFRARRALSLDDRPQFRVDAEIDFLRCHGGRGSRPPVYPADRGNYCGCSYPTCGS
jgi:hypothetical protein